MTDAQLLKAIGRSTSVFNHAQPRRMYCTNDGEHITIFVTGSAFPVAKIRYSLKESSQGAPVLMIDSDLHDGRGRR